MNTKDTGGPAFPITIENVTSGGEFGMTLRDYFAAKAMQGIIAGSHDERGTVEYDEGTVAGSAYKMADAMLAARSAI